MIKKVIVWATVPEYYFKYLELQGSPRDWELNCIFLPVSCACCAISLPALGLYRRYYILKGKEKMDF